MIPMLPTMRTPEAGGVMSVLAWQSRALQNTPATQFFEVQIFSPKAMLARLDQLDSSSGSTDENPTLYGFGGF